MGSKRGVFASSCCPFNHIRNLSWCSHINTGSTGPKFETSNLQTVSLNSKRFAGVFSTICKHWLWQLLSPRTVASSWGNACSTSARARQKPCPGCASAGNEKGMVRSKVEAVLQRYHTPSSHPRPPKKAG